jgi:hypothetical protein
MTKEAKSVKKLLMQRIDILFKEIAECKQSKNQKKINRYTAYRINEILMINRIIDYITEIDKSNIA